MPSPVVGLCPMKPAPEPARVVYPVDPIASARLPSNSCDGDRCSWFLFTQDARGNRVPMGCAIPAGVQVLAGLNSTIGLALASGKPAHPPTIPQG